MPDALRVENLRVEYPARRRGSSAFIAAEGISFSISAGETVALVGESGSGKTTIGNAVLGLVTPRAGSISVDGVDATTNTAAQRRRMAANLQTVFQDPYASLNPAIRVGRTLIEPLRVQGMSKADALARVDELLDRVGLPRDTASRYPGHFSGGQRQRIAIARALAVDPKVIVCDEPTSALDVSTQRRVIDLLREVQERSNVAYLFITHDLALVRRFADRVLVLAHGQLVEQGSAADICERPQHPYTQALIAAVPVPDPRLQRRRRLAKQEARSAADDAG